ncbi:MAG: histidine kinase, partial [Gemmatimonadaceae bacterium]|nr:histidine kinase [Chitinophagaceae bacterium]
GRKFAAQRLYITDFKVFNDPIATKVNFEQVKSISLKYDQDFFTIQLTALDNFSNPGKVYYGYRLEPFNKEWIYTQDRNISYTNLRGGDYQFFYKASHDPANWNVETHMLQIHIDTVFYKTAWFIGVIALVIAFLAFAFYRYRIDQAKNLHRLQLQATHLERDKTEIQYQNLLNQFNPHFLFNSLTSLNSLIYENRELASQFLEQLSAVYRYLLTNKETQLVTLQKESAFAVHYISLLKTRFEDSLSVVVQIPEELLGKKIVPVTFQLLIENAIKHNRLDKESSLIVTITADENYLYASNNLQRKEQVSSSNRKGLDSLQTLYKYLSSRPVIVKETAETFSIAIPLI